MKKFLSVLLAVAMVSVLVLGTAMAASIADNSGDANGVLNEGDDGTYWYAFAVAGAVDDVTKIASVTFTVSTDADTLASSGFGGGVIINSEANSWDSIEWGNADAGKDVTAVANGDLWDIELPVEEGDFTAEGTYNNAAIQHWWGAEIAIEGVTIKDASGNVLYTNISASEDAAEDATEDATEDAAEETPATDSSAKTADAMNVVMIAGLAVVALAGAVVAANKKNA